MDDAGHLAKPFGGSTPGGPLQPAPVALFQLLAVVER